VDCKKKKEAKKKKAITIVISYKDYTANLKDKRT
jgi:hypothetical protein